MPFAAPFTANGIAIIEHALLPADLEQMSAAFAHGNARHTALAPDLIAWLVAHPGLSEIARRLTGLEARLVRIIAFDKTPAANWFVPWHQDRSIAVAKRVECAGYGNWTTKDGFIQVEPPLAFLEAIATLRIHLDDCGEDNGPLEVIPGSHTAGRLDRAHIASVVEASPHRLCLAARGDILCLRPLILNRSQRAKVPSQRRVLHLEFAGLPLASGLTWAPLEVANA